MPTPRWRSSTASARPPTRWPTQSRRDGGRSPPPRSRRDAHPHRQLQRPLRGHRRIDRRPRRPECSTHPVTGALEYQPPYASITARNTSSCAASAARIPSASASHQRVEPSTSVNRNVTTPEGAAAGAADTPAESHNRRAATLHIAGIRPQTSTFRGSRRSALPVGRIAGAIWHMLAGQR